jgi:4-hydroxy-tetrahydrodipicolinate synthase
MSSPRFRGAITALVTPMRDGTVDETAFTALVEHQVEQGVHGLVPAGTTGESATLTDAEHRRVVEICAEVAAGQVPVIAGAGSSSTARSIELGLQAKAAGADALLIAAPPYNRPSQAGLYAHFAAIAEAVDLPVVIYNVPSRTACDIATETVVRLAALPNIVGIKDATGDLSRVSLMRREVPDAFALISGDDPSALGYVAQGGHGVISVTSNVHPSAVAGMMEAALDGDFGSAVAIQDRLIRLHKALFLDSSPGPTKFALSTLQQGSEEVRLPLVACAQGVRDEILAAMEEAGL